MRARSRRTWVIAAAVLVVAAGVPAVLVAVQGSDPGLPRLPRPDARGGGQPGAVVPVATAAADGSGGVAATIGQSQPAVGGLDTPVWAKDTVVVSLRDPADTTAITSRGGTVAGEIPGTGFVKVRITGDPAALVSALQADPTVAAASLDYGRHKTAVPNDAFYRQYQQTYLNTIGMPAAWDRHLDASAQIVAVIDTGVDTSHPDLVGRTVAGFNAVFPGMPPTDSDGHGTFVAGVIAANADNGVGVAGVTWNGRVMPVRVFASSTAFDSDVATGITWAVDHGAKVINLSLGGPGASSVLQAAVQYALDNNVIVVAASGNSGNDTPQYPAAYDGVIAVGATDPFGKLVDFSSYGDWLDVAAPGFSIVSTYPGNSYAIGDGTSFAAPMVSGVAALMRARLPGYTSAQVADLLRHSARDAGPRGIDPFYGFGVLNADLALGATGPAVVAYPMPDLGPGEPNDTPDRAIALTSGSALSATFAVEGDIDWYKITASSPQSLTATVQTPTYNETNGQNADPVIDVYNSGLGRIAHADSNDPTADETVSGVPIQPGTNYIKISNYNGTADRDAYTLTVSTAAATPTSTFGVESVNLGTSPEALLIADLTGDGRPDLAYSTVYNGGIDPVEDDDKIFVRAQQPDGTLAPPVRYDQAHGELTAMDVDQDRRVDLVTRFLHWFRQDETGHLTYQGKLVADVQVFVLVAVTDVNGDGRKDILMAIPGGSPGTYALVHGDGSSFTTTSEPDLTCSGYVVGDVNSDGRDDLVCSEAGAIKVFTYGPTGWTPATYAAPTGYSSYAIGDVTGDGRNDIVATDTNGTLTVFPQNNDGSIGAARGYGGSTSTAIAIGDVDDDGRADVVTYNRSWGSVTVYRQSQTGTLRSGIVVRTPMNQHYGPQTVAIGDLDSSGKLATAAVNDNGLSFIRYGALALAADRQALVRAVTPIEYSTGATSTVNPQVVFATDVNASTVTSNSVLLIDGYTGQAVPATVSYDATLRAATISPTQPLRLGVPYRIVVKGVQALNGLTTEPFASTFKTVAPASSPPPQPTH